MPVYEYQCSKCKQKTEYLQKFTDKPKQICEQCGGKLKKLLSQSSFVLKGTGWYKTDYSESHREVLDKKVSTTGNPIADADTNIKT